MAHKPFQQGIELPAPFIAGSCDPIDPRLIVEDKEDLTINAATTFGLIGGIYCKVYQGITVYVTSEQSKYMYIGPAVENNGILLTEVQKEENWVKVADPENVTKLDNFNYHIVYLPKNTSISLTQQELYSNKLVFQKILKHKSKNSSLDLIKIIITGVADYEDYSNDIGSVTLVYDTFIMIFSKSYNSSNSFSYYILNSDGTAQRYSECFLIDDNIVKKGNIIVGEVTSSGIKTITNSELKTINNESLLGSGNIQLSTDEEKVNNLQKYLICTDEQDIDVDKDFAVLMKDGTYFVIKNIDWSEVGATWYYPNEKFVSFAYWRLEEPWSNLWEGEYNPKFKEIISLGDLTKVNNKIYLLGRFKLPKYINTGKNSEGKDNPLTVLNTFFMPENELPCKINGLGLYKVGGDFPGVFEGTFEYDKVVAEDPNESASISFQNSYFGRFTEENKSRINIKLKNYKRLQFLSSDIPKLSALKITDTTNTITRLSFEYCNLGEWFTSSSSALTNLWKSIFSNLTNISQLFYGCSFANKPDVTLDLTNLNLDKVTIAGSIFNSVGPYAFNDSSGLKSVKISLPNVTDINAGFASMPSLEEITITNLGTLENGCQCVFVGDDNLRKLSINMSKVTNTFNLFALSWSDNEMGDSATNSHSPWPKLTDVTLTGLKTDLNLTYLIALSDESIARILNEAATVTTPKTLTINTHVYNRLTQEQISNFEAKGWTLAHTTNAKCDAAYNQVVVSHEALESVKAELEDKVNTVKDGFKVEGETLTINI